jgi:hypothetical protein
MGQHYHGVYRSAEERSPFVADSAFGPDNG